MDARKVETITGNARKAAGASQAEFAELANVSLACYSMHERKPGQHRVDELREIAESLNGFARFVMAEALVRYVFGDDYMIVNS